MKSTQSYRRLSKPAKVGAVRFQAGVSERLVIEAAQRLYEAEVTPEKEAERIARGEKQQTAIMELQAKLQAGLLGKVAAPIETMSILREARESVHYHKGMQNLGHEAGQRHAAKLATLLERIDAILDGGEA